MARKAEAAPEPTKPTPIAMVGGGSSVGVRARRLRKRPNACRGGAHRPPSAPIPCGSGLGHGPDPPLALTGAPDPPRTAAVSAMVGGQAAPAGASADVTESRPMTPRLGGWLRLGSSGLPLLALYVLSPAASPSELSAGTSNIVSSLRPPAATIWSMTASMQGVTLADMRLGKPATYFFRALCAA